MGVPPVVEGFSMILSLIVKRNYIYILVSIQHMSTWIVYVMLI